MRNTFKDVRACALDRVCFLSRYTENSIELRELKQILDVICRLQEDQLAAFVSNGSPDGDQLTQTETVDVRNVRHVHYERAVTFFQ